jgi:hypothetical protein
MRMCQRQWGVSYEEIVGDYRRLPVTHCKAAFAHACREQLLMSYPEIGRELRTGHSTAIGLCDRARRWMRDGTRTRIVTRDGMVDRTFRLAVGRIRFGLLELVGGAGDTPASRLAVQIDGRQAEKFRWEWRQRA